MSNQPNIPNCSSMSTHNEKTLFLKQSKIVLNTKKFVKFLFRHHDSSHDFFHLERVSELSLKIAELENIKNYDRISIIYISALLHDVNDYKYKKNDDDDSVDRIKEFLEKEKYEYIDDVLKIIELCSFSKELDGINKKEMSIEGKIVQDADRLDAIGAIGIARCFLYSGKVKQTLYDPHVKIHENINSSEAYKCKSKKTTAINHFYEKLLKISSLMKTETGKKIAKTRHDYMKMYLKQFYIEWNANDLDKLFEPESKPEHVVCINYLLK